MKERIFTYMELANMPTNEWKCFNIAMEAKAYRLIGINWFKWVTVEESFLPGQVIVFRWE